MRKRAIFGRVGGAFTPVMLGCLAAVSCADFDTTRAAPQRGTLGAELFGVVCDRVGGQSLHEDLTGSSFRAICHGETGNGVFGDASAKVDTDKLAPISGDSATLDGGSVTEAKQNADRAYGIARLERLAAVRSKLVAALDATFPDIRVDVKDTGNADPTKTCDAAPGDGKGSLHTELANLLGRFTALYDDGTLPASTEALGALVDAISTSPQAGAQTAWSHFNQRAGYRPAGVALGAARPLLAYKDIRAFANATSKILAPDSNPYDPAAKKDANGNRIATPGPGYPQMQALLAGIRGELANAVDDPPLDPLLLASTQDATVKRTVLNRPRTDLEVLQATLFTPNAAFGKAPFDTSLPSQYIVQRDPRGYAVVASTAGTFPTPFMKGADGLPALAASGDFMTSGGSAPTPFLADPADKTARDSFGRALGSGKLIYSYVDTTQTYLSAFLGHVRGVASPSHLSLVDSNPTDNHETLMNTLAGLHVLFGARADTTKTYADKTTVKYSGYQAATGPVGDFVYALGQMLADPSTDATLAMTSQLVSAHTSDTARVIGDGLYAKSLADADMSAKIPAASTLWDDVIDVVVQIAQDTSKGPTGRTLLEDMLVAFADPASVGLTQAFGVQMANIDAISYDRSNLNGPVVNLTTKDASPPKTPANRNKPDTGANRSQFQRFAQLIRDSRGVAFCNKEGAILHAKGTAVGDTDICATTDGKNEGTQCGASGGSRNFHECEVVKIDDLAAFYLDSIAGLPTAGALNFRPLAVRTGILGLGATSVAVTEQSSGIGLKTAPTADDTYNDPTNPNQPGFWALAATQDLRPKAPWLNRQIFFDQKNDTANTLTNKFLTDFQGLDVGTSVCPERVIADPCFKSGAADPDCGTNAAVAADGMVHGLRQCADGDWMTQRDQDTLFLLEDANFYTSVQPMAKAFVSHKREDLFSGLLAAADVHWQSAGGTAAECRVGLDSKGKAIPCSKDGASSYEPLLAKIFSADLMTGLNTLTKVVQSIEVPTCATVDATKHTCTTPGPTLDGIGVLAQAIRGILDPAVAKTYGITDPTGNVKGLRNDGTTNPQVTPLYLFLQALNEFDAAFTALPAGAENRKAEWRSARSQIVDELLTTTNENAPAKAQGFLDPSFPIITPVLLDALRAQVLARCGASITTGKCPWARGILPGSGDSSCTPGMTSGSNGCAVPAALWNEVVAATGGPSFAGALDVLDAIRQDTDGRTTEENLLAYLVDPNKVDALGKAESLSQLLSTSHDVMQLFIDDTNLVPVYNAFASAFAPPKDHPTGRNVIDSTTALLARIAGHALDANGKEICSNELDPNSVVDVALSHLVTPMAASSDNVGESPLEVMVDAIAYVNRTPGADPAKPLVAADYTNINQELNSFLVDQDRGLEQFYAIVRHATEPQ